MEWVGNWKGFVRAAEAYFMFTAVSAWPGLRHVGGLREADGVLEHDMSTWGRLGWGMLVPGGCLSMTWGWLLAKGGGNTLWLLTGALIATPPYRSHHQHTERIKWKENTWHLNNSIVQLSKKAKRWWQHSISLLYCVLLPMRPAQDDVR